MYIYIYKVRIYIYIYIYIKYKNVYIYKVYIDLSEILYGDPILWRPISIIETTLWRPNFEDLISWKLYYRNLIMGTIYISWRPNYGDLILRPYIINYIDSI